MDVRPRQFVYDVIPTAEAHTFISPVVVAALVALIVLGLGLCVRVVNPVLGYLAEAGLAALLLAWASGNPVLATYAEFDQARGAVPSTDGSVGAFRPWATGAVCVAIVLSPAPYIAAIAAPAVLVFRIVSMTSDVDLPYDELHQEFGGMMAVQLGYPDRDRIENPGAAAMWFPSSSALERATDVAIYLAPLYVALEIAVRRWWLPGHVGAGEPCCGDLVAIGWIVVVMHSALFADQIRPLSEHLGRRVPDPTGNEWEQAVALVSCSRHVEGNVALADHFFIGWFPPANEAAEHPFKVVGEFDVPCRTPALLHRSIINGHVHLLGSSMSGKTSIGLMTLLIQVLRGWIEREVDALGELIRDQDGNPTWVSAPCMPVLIIDLKGDLALFNTVREECERNGRTFKYFTLTTGLATSYFNALPNLGVRERHVAEFCELVLNALSLFHGLSYGRSYYSKQSRDLLLRAVKYANPKPTSWEALHQLLLDEIDPKKHRDVFELMSSIYALAQYPMLGPAPQGVDEIHMPTVVAERQVVYFNLPARLSAVSARDVGKLALFAFITAAADWNDRNPERRSVVCMDEGQILCSSNLATLIQQSSGAKTSIVFSNQAAADLNVPDAPNLANTVRVNTRFKQMFTVADPRDATDLIRASGERVGLLRTFGGEGIDDVTRVTETLCPVLTQNEINAVNNDRNGSLIHVTTDAGFTDLGGVPRHIQTPYPLDLAEYHRRLHTPWPTAVTPPARPGRLRGWP
jgi:hypothetical protein